MSSLLYILVLTFIGLSFIVIVMNYVRRLRTSESVEMDADIVATFPCRVWVWRGNQYVYCKNGFASLDIAIGSRYIHISTKSDFIARLTGFNWYLDISNTTIRRTNGSDIVGFWPSPYANKEFIIITDYSISPIQLALCSRDGIDELWESLLKSGVRI